MPLHFREEVCAFIAGKSNECRSSITQTYTVMSCCGQSDRVPVMFGDNALKRSLSAGFEEGNDFHHQTLRRGIEEYQLSGS